VAVLDRRQASGVRHQEFVNFHLSPVARRLKPNIDCININW
jgi:hypothetical protein